MKMANASMAELVAGMSAMSIAQKRPVKSKPKKKRARQAAAVQAGERRLEAIKEALGQSPAKSDWKRKLKQGQLQKINAALDKFDRSVAALPDPN